MDPLSLAFGKQCFLFCMVYLTVCECVYPPESLRHVNLLYRHGDRSPVSIYPKDINQLNAWPDGLGWLSNIGKQQQYEVGQYLRQRYGGFINVTRYRHEEIQVEASAIQRCLMSAYSNLAGLFPPQGEQLWDKDLVWQPVPVLTRPLAEDNKLAMKKSCPRYDQVLQEVYHSEKVRHYQEQNKEFLKYVSINSGIPNENIKNVWSVLDALFCEKMHNMTWNDWAYKNGSFEKLGLLEVFGWQLLYGTPELAKLKGGPLLKEMIENMKFAASHNSSDLPKIHMYSAHDSTVAALLSAMSIFNRLQPPYRAMVMMELHEIESQHVVKVLYRNDTSQEPYHLPLKGCEDPCKLETFESLMKDAVPEDWEKECQLLAASPNSLSIATYLALGISILVVVVVCVGIVNILIRRIRFPYSKL